MDCTFATATAADADAIVALVNSAYRGESSKAGWTFESSFLAGQRTDRAMILSAIALSDTSIVLMYSAGELVGCCELQHHTGGAQCHLGMFTISPTLQNKGLGKRLLAHAERLARERWQCTGMQITVIHIRTELIAYYERRGFARTGAVENFPYGDERFGMPLVQGLTFVEMCKPL